MSSQITPDVAARPVAGVNLSASTFGEVAGGGPALLVFRRHFG
jgi:hypothetical protein